jgi:hypothetical protein
MEETYEILEAKLRRDMYKNVKKFNKSELDFTLLIKNLIETARCADEKNMADIAKESRENIVECLRLRKEARQHSKDTIKLLYKYCYQYVDAVKPLSEAYGRCNNEDKSRVN